MKSLNFNENENYSEFTLTFEQCSRIWDYQQRKIARQQIRKQDRKKTTLTFIEKLDKWAKLGNMVAKAGIGFVYDHALGMTKLITDSGTTYNATISDWARAVEKKTGESLAKYYEN